MASRKSFRWLLIGSVIVILFYLHTSTRLPKQRVAIPLLSLRKSSYDWSTWKPYHPIASLVPLPSHRPLSIPKIQAELKGQSKSDILLQEKRRDFVKKTLTKSWRSYKELAWMRDELKPVTGEGKDPFGGWAATAVDGLDTLWIMDMKPEFYEAARAIVGLDWASTNSTACIVFETTIRHLGGLLSAYDLSQESALLEKAVELGDMLYAAFDTPNHIPPFWLDYEKAKSGRLIADDHQPSATVATLSLEFTRLAQLTKNDKYYDAIARVTDRLHDSQNKTSIPGIWPMYIDARNDNFAGEVWDSFTLGALSDSLYEYIPKMHLLLRGTEPKYEQMWRKASKTLIASVIFRPMTPDNLDILLTGTTTRMEPGVIELQSESEHLACFAGGMFALGGKLFDIPEHIDIGARLTKGCIWAYDAFPSGIMPEIFKVAACDTLEPCAWDEERWAQATVVDPMHDRLQKGFIHARDPRYLLRPEALESVFYLYRITGDEEYRTAAWRMISNIINATDTVYGNSAIDDVRTIHTTKQDSQESFWFAETLKYAYLTFSPQDYMSLDDFVLNTEAHPLRLART